MKKDSFFSFLLRFIFANLLSLAVYLATIILINFISGGAINKMSGAYSWMGYTADDVSLGLRVFIQTFLIVVYLLMIVLFYVFLYLRTSKNKVIHDDFMKYIGAAPFDRNEFVNSYMKTGSGKNEFKYFSIIIGVGALITALGIPILGFFIILMISQSAVTFIVSELTPLMGIARRIVQALLIIIVNIPLFYLYQTKIAPRIYEKWASERLRIDKQ